jgi:O-succinylbenzoic acid--CoA ligase
MIWTAPHPAFRLRIGNKSFDWQEFKSSGTGPELDFLMDWCAPNPEIFAQTSGTTGTPKTITLKKSAMYASAKKTGDFLALQAGNKALLCLSSAHIAGKMMLVRAWLLGLELTITQPSAAPLTDLEGNWDFAAMVPHQAAGSLKDLHRIKKLILGGGEISQKLWNQLIEAPSQIFQTFGATETVSHFAMRRVAANGFSEPYHCLSGVTVGVNQGNCLIVKATDILSAPLQTNDVVEILDARTFRWLGRADAVINSGGVKLHPEVLEQRLLAKGLEEVFFVGLPHPTLGEQLTLVLPPNVVWNPDLVLDWHVYERPKVVVHLDGIPRTNNGKVLRNELLNRVLMLV